ncbi:MAG: hypothetical protein E7000_00225 [Coriobacteriaceae bacterium]|nr:hypothetical protein [Coriobacteriaceae bacterium]
MAAQKGITRAFQWRGLMAESPRLLRVMLFVASFLVCGSLMFCQLGFAGITLPAAFGARESAYIVVLLLPVAVGSLMLGVLSGATLGLIAGAIMYIHAVWLPLDYYELVYVTPVTSIVMFTVMGFLLAVLFAFALGGNPPTPRRVVSIILICLVVSWLYSLGFITSVVSSILGEIASRVNLADLGVSQPGDSAIAAAAVDWAVRLGDVRVQAWLDGALMAGACVLADALARRIDAWRAGVSLSVLFGVGLVAVGVVTFSVMAEVSFVAITQTERDAAYALMQSETTYLCNQLDESSDRVQAVEELIDTLVAGSGEFDAEKAFDDYARGISIDGLLNGYTVEADGIVLITSGKNVYLSNVEGLDTSDAPEVLPEIYDAMQASLESGEMQRIVFDDTILRETPAETLASISADTDGMAHNVIPEIAYLYSQRQADDGATATMIMPAEMVYANRIDTMTSTTLTTFVLLLAVFIMVSQLLNRMVLQRIVKTNEVLGRITGGDLDARVDEPITLEFRSLSDGINTTVDAMKGWIREAETRMDAELATAKAIQESALPRIFPPYPDILKFDIYASMNAAKEVGGDFYDFFLVGEGCTPESGKLGFVVADVSGKGVPAALFMMEAKSQIRNYVSSGMELGEAIENVNHLLCDGNEAGMFVTAWVGVLDYGTGHIDYVNAGHNPPLMWAYGSEEDAPDGAGALPNSWRWLRKRSGIPLGMFDGLPYRTFSLDCRPGEQLLLFTDGVTEAMDAAEEQYGEARLEALAKGNVSLHPRALVEAVRRDVAAFAGDAEQSDDITILSLEVGVPPELTSTISVPADVDELTRVYEFIHAELDRRLCPLRAQNQIDIAVEELFVNSCRYAYPDATEEDPGIVHVSYTYSAEPPAVAIDIIDNGIPFDPLAKPDAVTPGDIMDVPIGGLGILMAKRSVDEMRYERVDGSNVVTLVKRW